MLFSNQHSTIFFYDIKVTNLTRKCGHCVKWQQQSDIWHGSMCDWDLLSMEKVDVYDVINQAIDLGHDRWGFFNRYIP